MTKTPPKDCADCSSFESSIFCSLHAKDLSQIDTNKNHKQFKRHSIIFNEGSKPEGVFCIQSGKVKIYRSNSNGEQYIVRLANGGDLLGYRSLITNEPYQASAEALDDIECCFIPRNTILSALENNPATTFKLFEKVARELGKAEGQIIRIAHKTIRARMAELLLDLQFRFGEKSENGIVIDLNLTRAEMANLIGTTQESMIRLISSFKTEGLIKAAGRKITILDAASLSEIAQIDD